MNSTSEPNVRERALSLGAVLDPDAEGALHDHDELERVDRVEADAVGTEKRRVGLQLLGLQVLEVELLAEHGAHLVGEIHRGEKATTHRVADPP